MRGSITSAELEVLRDLLCALGSEIRARVIAGRRAAGEEAMNSVVDVTEADTIYAIDKISEEAVLEWFESHWPADRPVELVMEGLKEGGRCTFPIGIKTADCLWTCIIDPIDGTRPLMYDKRSAWALCALAPRHGFEPELADIVVAVMTELPTTKAGFADQISAVIGEGLNGIRALRSNLFTDECSVLFLRPSKAVDVLHGFGQFSKFFPDGKMFTAAMEERLAELLTGNKHHDSPVLFDDQYISTGGQFYEILVGHDRFCVDIRPLVFKKIGCSSSLVCHPYDACCWLILQEAGCIVEKPDGSPLDAPLDTVSPVSWVAYANNDLATKIRPVLRQVMQEFLPGLD
jgi:fructose-1,6-bisphosphatase/inositol monophosphatase family enzyme